MKLKFFQSQVETVASLPPIPNSGPLRRQIAQSFTLDEIRTLCFDLDVDYDELRGETKSSRIVSLVEYMQHRQRLDNLLLELRNQRPRSNWQNPLVLNDHDLRNRQNVLNNVKATWIDGYLKNTLSVELTLELDLAHQPTAVARQTLYLPGEAERSIEQSLRTVFEEHGRSLLILGAPGSGKTITLLQLAKDLIQDAQEDPTQPIPMILNLTSWAQEKKSLTDWLVEEIFMQYQVSQKLSRTWIEANQLLYLLDGLDEVAEEAREACITAVNDFKAHYPAEIIICSRTEDYARLQNRLNLGTAVHIQPLTNAQIHDYLNREDLGLTAVRDSLGSDSELNELAHSPLFLSIMTLAYRGISRADLDSFDSIADRRRHLFDRYVNEMFARRPLRNTAYYQKEKSLQWLKNLAQGMKGHSQYVFYIEHLQPTWLPSETLRNQYLLGVKTISSLIDGLAFGLIGWFIAWTIWKLNGQFWTPLGFEVKPITGLIVGLAFGLAIGLFDAVFGEAHWLHFLIKPVGNLSWSLPPRHQIPRMLGAFLFGGLDSVLEATTSIHKMEHSFTPNQGIHNSGITALRIWLIAGLGPWLIIGLFLGAISGRLFFGLSIGLVFGVFHGINRASAFGGSAYLSHYMLRLLLTRNSILPFPLSDRRLAAFLDDMTDRILLRRVGGGWVFIHRTLLDYFASRQV
ncbi:MAG: NACHT domain-containing protein [Anaerolineae bacterium]|nr:NACHT domain-containing protein [Anaerolineae bacterium]